MAITWKTLRSEKGYVEYGIGHNLQNTISALNYYSPQCRHYINVAHLNSLQPDTVYYYRCGRPGAWSKISYFKTGHNGKKPFSFVSFGDTHSRNGKVTHIKEAIKQYNPEFILHTGDYVFNGNIQLLWDRWFSAMKGLLEYCPFMGILGNHDRDSQNYFDQFMFTSRQKYYSFDYGNAHFTMIYNTKRTQCIDPGSSQYSWIEKDLKKADLNSSIDWKFAFWHVPAYSSSMFRPDKKLINSLYPLLEKFGVDVVFTGHRHNYERTYMLKGNKVVQKGPDFASEREKAGIISIVSGGGGGRLKNANTQWWTAHTESSHHFCHINVNSNKLFFKAIRPDHTVLDSFTIIKN